MPPVQVITDDTMSSMIRFRTSAIYEMIVSLEAILRPTRRPQWVNQARAELSEDFIEEVRYLYETLPMMWVEYLELPVDYQNQHDIEGFLDYVRKMPAADFIFYVSGRRLSREEIATIGLDSAALTAAIRAQFGSYCEDLDHDELPLTIILKDVAAFQNRLADLWATYWHGYFHTQIDFIEHHWKQGLVSNEYVLSQRGTDAFFEHLLGRQIKLPPELPPGYPITEIILTPIYLIPNRAFIFYGYGNLTILFDSELTEDRVQEINRRRDEALGALRALGDPTRLKILRLIAQGEGRINGKKIASALEMSPSTVSRQLAQLRDGGLIEEEPLDHRNIAYRLKKETITSIPSSILDYLYT